MIVEVHTAGAERLIVTLDLAAPRAGLEEKADVALEELTGLHLTGAVMQADDTAIEVIFVLTQWTEWDAGSA